VKIAFDQERARHSLSAAWKGACRPVGASGDWCQSRPFFRYNAFALYEGHEYESRAFHFAALFVHRHKDVVQFMFQPAQNSSSSFSSCIVSN
jgi:hypothetical protein